MQQVGEILARDHRWLEGMLHQSVVEAEAKQWRAATASLNGFRHGIERHMKLEEQLLFPAIENGTEMPLTAILRKGHRDLRAFLDELNDALGARESEEYKRVAKLVSALLSHHDKKEEEEFYPVVQLRLGADAKAAVKKLRRLSGRS